MRILLAFGADRGHFEPLAPIAGGRRRGADEIAALPGPDHAGELLNTLPS